MSPQALVVTILTLTLVIVGLSVAICYLWDVVRDVKGWQ